MTEEVKLKVTLIDVLIETAEMMLPDVLKGDSDAE